jgi:hypothetical protein
MFEGRGDFGRRRSQPAESKFLSFWLGCFARLFISGQDNFLNDQWDFLKCRSKRGPGDGAGMISPKITQNKKSDIEGAQLNEVP